MENYLGQIALLIGLTLLNGFFAAAEIALISARKSALINRSEEGHKGAHLALKLTEDPTKMISTTQIGKSLIGILSGAIATLTFAEPLTRFLLSLGWNWITPLASSLAILVMTIILSYVTLVLGELVPKRLGIIEADRVAEFVSRPISWLQSLATPIVWLLTVSTESLSTLAGLTDDKLDDEAGEEEIKMLVTEQDTLEDAEKRMIHEIFDLADTVAREIMTPRVDVVAAQDGDTLAEVMELLEKTGFSRVPVLHGGPDKVVGIAYFKDIARAQSDDLDDEIITHHMREALYVPETKDILSLLEEMQNNHMHMMVVVDEHGGTAGIVTMEDIVEEVVGEITDEFDADRSDLIWSDDGNWLVEGRMSVDDAVELGFPLEESDEYDTIAGWFLEQIGYIPRAGERIDHEGFSFGVQKMRRRRIARIRVVDERSDEEKADSTLL